MKKYTVLFLLLATVLLGCEPRIETKEIRVKEETQDRLLLPALYMQQAAEYQALCYQSYALAEMQLKKALQSKVQKPAVILDLDETVLDNSPYTAWQIMNNEAYTPETWNTWVELAEAPTIPGAYEFLKLADSMSVALFYISNRKVEEQEATIRNMQKLGLPQSTEEHFLLKSNTSVKTERRNKVLEMGYTPVLFIGDNLGDFDELWDTGTVNERSRNTIKNIELFGTKYIVLPNPVYGTWDKALYDYNRSLSDSEKDSLRKSFLVLPLGKM